MEEGHVLGDMLKGIPCKQRAKASWTDGTTGTTAEKTVSYCQKPSVCDLHGRTHAVRLQWNTDRAKLGRAG